MPNMTVALAGLNRLRIGTLLTGAFVVVLLMTATLGGVAYWALIQVSEATDDLADKWLPGAGHLATTRAAMLEVQDFQRRLSRAADASYVAEYEEKQTAAQARFKAAYDAHLEKVTHGTEQALGQAFVQAWSSFEQTNQRIRSLAQSGKMDDAREVSDGAGQLGFDEALAAFDKLTACHFELAAASAKVAEQVDQRSRRWVLGLASGAVVFGLALASVITRRLLAQLGGEPADAVRLAAAVAQGDLATRVNLKPGDHHSVMAQLHAMQASLAGVVQRVRSGSEQVATASAEIASGNNDLSARTEQQASALQQTAASMEQLGTTVRHNADNANQANQLAREASTVAAQGGQAVSEVVQTMRGINESSRRIADITGVIDGIAFQTNILALNAAVEAARAGEQGRGFAVVAGEVRTLAQRSADAAREIKQLIAASVERVEQGTAQVDRAGATMQQVVTSIQRVSDIVGEISTASGEQSSGVQQVGEAVSAMDQATQQNAALVEQSAAAAESLKHQAQALVQAVAVFRGVH